MRFSRRWILTLVWATTLCSPIGKCQHLGGKYCLHPQGNFGKFTQKTREIYSICSQTSVRTKKKHHILRVFLWGPFGCSTHQVSLLTGMLIRPWSDLFPDVFFFMVRIFLLMLIFIYIYIYINSINIPPIMIINRIYETQNLLSL
jgi:hypothetical protein